MTAVRTLSLSLLILLPFSPDDFPQVLFQNETTRAAAVLSLPLASRRENTLIRNVFGRWMLKNIDTWFAFARNLGLVRQMEEIILVTGCDLTRSWTNVAFLGGRVDAQVSFGVEVKGPNSNPSINFQFSPGRVRGAVLHCGPEGTVCCTPFETINGFGTALARLCAH